MADLDDITPMTIDAALLREVAGAEFAGYRDVHEWREATFGDVQKTWDPTRSDGFGGYATKHDWSKANFGDRR